LTPISLEFQSTLHATAEEAWEWITSLDGISAELSPYLRMTAPPGIERIDHVAVVPGEVLFRSRILLFRFLPVDHSDITLVEFDEGAGFVEQSPMGMMRSWRHERRIERVGEGCTITDRLTFEPRFGRALTKWLITRLFTHRHAKLRRHLGAH